MDEKLKECPFCGSNNIDPEEWSSATDSGPGCGDCGALADSVEKWNARAIAPPVAAGRADTLQRFELTESHYGTGYMVHWDKAMEEDADGEWVKHADAIAWGAQQREAGHREGYADGKGMADEIVAAIDKATQVRAEKAEADLIQVNQWYRTAHQINEDLAARILKADERVEELETEIKVLHRG